MKPDEEERRVYMKNWRQAYKEKNGNGYDVARAAKKTAEVVKTLGRCQNPSCATFFVLEFAHILDRPTPLSLKYHKGRGVINRYYDIMNHPDCYTFFCRSCHDLYDAGKLDIQPKSLLELQDEARVKVFKVLAGDTPSPNVPIV